MQPYHYNGSVEVPKHCSFGVVHYLVERILSNPDPFIEPVENIFDMQIDDSMFQVIPANFGSTYFEINYNHHTLRVFVSVNAETNGIVVDMYLDPFQINDSFDREFESFIIEVKVWRVIRDAVRKYSNDCKNNRKPYDSVFERFVIDRMVELYTPRAQSEPYRVSPRHIYSTSVNSQYYDKSEIDDIVYISMCNLYEKVIPRSTMTDELYSKMVEMGIQPPEAHEPYPTRITDESYVYTSEYKHNKLNVTIMEHDPGSINSRLFVQFTIVPKYTPTIECDMECRQIEDLVLDKIYENVQEQFEVRKAEWTRDYEYDEHSYQGQQIV